MPPRKKKSTTTSDPSKDYWSSAASSSWVSDTMKKNGGFNPVAFRRTIADGKLLVKGKDIVGHVPFVPNKQQAAIYDLIVKNREASKPTELLIVKGRQGAGITTGLAAFITSEAFSNAGFNSLVSAVQKETIATIWQTYRTMKQSLTGEIEEESTTRRGKSRENDVFMDMPKTLSRIYIQNATSNLGRAGNVLNWHGSEADYYPDFGRAMDSAMPAMSKSPLRTIVLETTMNHAASSEFKDFVGAVHAQKSSDLISGRQWSLLFIPWFEMEVFREPIPSHEFLGKFLNSLDTEEVKLWKAGVHPEAILWRRNSITIDFRGRRSGFVEAYPSTIEEALDIFGNAQWLHADAIKFYRARVSEPVKYLAVDATATLRIRELSDPRDREFTHHARVWRQPEAGRRYMITADCADSKGSLRETGSENYAVVWDYDTGDQVAEWHARSAIYEFSNALAALGEWYNSALIAPEANYDGKAVIERLNIHFQYPNLYRREVYDSLRPTETELLGFFTTSQTRDLLIDRLRFAFNTRRLGIRSPHLLEQLLAFAARQGVQLKQVDKARGLHDDGAIAAAIACTVHDRSNAWQPWLLEIGEPLSSPLEQQNNKILANRKRRGYTIAELEDEIAESRMARLRRLYQNRT